ncbi:MAG: hypothetical protein JST92_02875, partial [Deltaproteobacteria bacterium]|nr:hypothetical protein [Deltaproteobacteria bacterium]
NADADAQQKADRRGRSRKKGRYAKDELERSPERVFLPGQKNPIVLRQNTSEMFLLQRLRDEAHRFAITFHRKLRTERNFVSVLEQIEGIGEKRKRALLSRFGGLKKIRAATVEELAETPGFNTELAQRVREFFDAQAAQLDAAAASDPDAQAAPTGEAAQREDVAFDAAGAELAELEDDAPIVDEPGVEETVG